MKSIFYVSVHAQHNVWVPLVLIPPKSYHYNGRFLGSNLLTQLIEDLQEGIPAGLIEIIIKPLIYLIPYYIVL